MMFVGYRLCNGEYGYMCFTILPIDVIHKIIEHSLNCKVNILFIRLFSNTVINRVNVFCKNKYNNVNVKHIVSNIIELDIMYRSLFKKLGFFNILGFY